MMFLYDENDDHDEHDECGDGSIDSCSPKECYEIKKKILFCLILMNDWMNPLFLFKSLKMKFFAYLFFEILLFHNTLTLLHDASR